MTFLGEEGSQEKFIGENMNDEIEKIFLYKKNAPTIVKRRFIDQYSFTKVLEIYEMDDRELSAEEDEKYYSLLSERLPEFDVVIVVDFGHGMMSARAIEVVCEKSRFLAVNAQSNAGNIGYHTISTYPRADFACMAENEIRLETRDRRGNLNEMILRVSKLLSGGRVAVTRGKFGSVCYGPQEGFNECPALAGEVVDRVGAGDTFLSLAAPCVARGVPLDVVNFIGNVAGAQAVATVGNRSPLRPVPVFRNIESLLK
jgi:bifunctional ADP-heptose synthase (sugar kinase/adenylyltransferase)